MAYNELLADRIRRILSEKRMDPEEKKMMGGLAFMIDGKMCVGVVKDNLMARVGPQVYEECLDRKGCRPMDFTGRPMKGFVFVEPDGTDLEKDLEEWVQLALDYNPEAKASKKR